MADGAEPLAGSAAVGDDRRMSRLPEVCVVTTDQNGSMDMHARDLAAHLPVPSVRIRTGGSSAEVFGAPLLSRAAVTGVARDVGIVRALRRSGRVLHLPHHHLARYGPPTGRPFVVTVHDVIRWMDMTGRSRFISRPTLRDSLGLRADYAAFARAAAIIAVSRRTKDDLVTHLALPAERITVIHEAVDVGGRFRPGGPRPVPDRYVLFVGSEQPRKNLPVLLEAFARLRRDPALADLRLVKVGAAGGENLRRHTLDAVRQLGLEGDVIFTGFVPDEALPAYYTHAEALVLPSRYEGFGFPPVEAMACACSVVVSSAGSLPEVVGDAALVVDPDDVPGLADALRRVLTEPGLREQLVAAGRRRAEGFRWDAVVEQTLAVYGRVSEEVGAPDA